MEHPAPRLRPLAFALAATLLSLSLALTVVAAPAHAQQSQPGAQEPDDSGDVPDGEPADGGWPWPEVPDENDGDGDDGDDGGGAEPQPHLQLEPQPARLPAPPPLRPMPIVPPLVKSKTIAGRVAMLRTDGTAAIPRGAPKRVRVLIARANQIIGKPYKWGGGHLKLVDRGYDCSGSVSYALINAGMLQGTMVSGAFKRWAAAGAGRWISVYAHRSHVYMEVAGLRLDTSSFGDVRQRNGVRWRPVIGKRRGFSTRHPVGL